jgi:hypothetical protein
MVQTNLRDIKKHRRGNLFFAKPKTPVFILGCQRSGTTICQNVFSEAKQFSVFREGNKQAMTDGWRLRPNADIEDLIERQKARLVIFKPINDSQSAIQMLARFDNSRIIWIYRNFNDTANSAVTRWGPAQRDMIVWIGEALGKYGSVEKAMPAIARKPGFAVYAENMSHETCDLLTRWTRSSITEHTGAAIMWYLRNQLFFEQRLGSSERSLLVSYEKFVQQPAEQLRRMGQFLNTRHLRNRAGDVFSTSIGKDKSPDISPGVLHACRALLGRLDLAEQSGESEHSRLS